MKMKIFTKEIRKEELDFTRWQTFNGDYVQISVVGSGYIERCMDMLELYMERYPTHKNYSIWKQYREIFEDELLSREPALLGTI